MKFLSPLLVLILAVFLSGCSTKSSATADSMRKASVKLMSKSGSEVQGSLKIKERNNNLWIRGTIRGLEPGKHGFHIHEVGDCSHPEAKSAGGHFASPGQEHGAKFMNSSHWGDLGNIHANSDGVAIVRVKSKRLCLDPAKACNILSRSVVVHAKRDDLKSQPSGAAGARVACGLIEGG